MRKILVLNGSPHKANSTTMVATNAFVRGMLSSGKYEAETVHITGLNIRPCMGCLSCWGRTEGECVIKNDDIPALKEKILASDILIASFPLYYFGIPGQFKVMMDRLLSMRAGAHLPLSEGRSEVHSDFRLRLQRDKRGLRPDPAGV